MEKWIPFVLIFYIVYITVLFGVISNTNIQIYDLTVEQQSVLSSPDADALTLLNKFLVLSQINSTYSLVMVFTGILTILFIIALGAAIATFLPFIGG